MTDSELQDVIKKLQEKKASSKEKDDYMEYLFEKGKISDDKYEEYKKGINVDAILTLGLIAGIPILAGIFIKKLTSDV